MLRRSPLKRRTRLPFRRKRERRSGRIRDRAFLEWIHSLPCFMQVYLWHRAIELQEIANPEEREMRREEFLGQQEIGLWRCRGTIEADHVGPRPLGRKSNDRECIPLCQKHHRARTDWTGLFKPWGKEQMRAFIADGLGWVSHMWAVHLDPDSEVPF